MQKTCFFSVGRSSYFQCSTQGQMSRVVRRLLDSRVVARAVPRPRASARRPPPCPVPSPPATRRWLRASCSTLALAWLASRIGRLPLLLAQAWRGSTLWASRRWALSIAGSLPTGSRLGGANKRSRSSRRGRGWSNPTGCVVAATLPFIVGCQASARRWCCARVRLLSLDVASMTSWSWLVSLAPRVVERRKIGSVAKWLAIFGWVE